MLKPHKMAALDFVTGRVQVEERPAATVGREFQALNDAQSGEGELPTREAATALASSDPRLRGLARVYEIDPLADQRWTDFVSCHPRSSVFHSPQWLKALKRTYGFTPTALTTSRPGSALKNAIVFCRIDSWITSPRLVSLPFSDHCDPLVDDDGELRTIVAAIPALCRCRPLRHIEVRARTHFGQMPQELTAYQQHCLHTLDLSPERNELFRALHKSCIQRKVKRAEKEQLQYAEGRSEEVLRVFYRLFVNTRQKHGVPPQPFQWFLNLAESLGSMMQVRVALCHGRPVASIITLVHRRTITYKYGCSDPELTSLGGTPWLFWKLIQQGKADGFRTLDLGRSDWSNQGLITFKDRLGAERQSLTYWRSISPAGFFPASADGNTYPLARSVFRRTPRCLLKVIGRLMYRHMG